MELVRFIFRCLLIAIVLGLITEWFIPAGDRIVDVATPVFAAATWVLPPAVIADGTSGRRTPRSAASVCPSA